jgi:hypothetical protein
MIRSIQSMRKLVDGLRKSVLHQAGRDHSWWFDEVLALAAFSKPSGLTGNQIAVLFSLDLCGMKNIQVTVQPEDYNRVFESIKRFPLIREETSAGLTYAQQKIGTAAVKFHCALGTVINDANEEMKVYILSTDGENSSALYDLLLKSGFTCAFETGVSEHILSSAMANCLLIGAGRRFGARTEYTFYFSAGGHGRFEHIQQVTFPLGNGAVARFTAFYDAITKQSLTSLRWGWAITLSEDGQLLSLKLEATPSFGDFGIAELLPALDALQYQWLKRAAYECGTVPQLQTVSCTLGPRGWGGCRYFKLNFSDEVSV